MIVLLRSIHASLDSRLTRYVRALDDLGTDSMVMHWARGGQGKFPSTRASLVTFPMKTSLGGGWKNAVALVCWMCWLFFSLTRKRRQVKVVHAVDLDTVIPALLFCKIFRKKLIFDIYDSYGDARDMGGVARRMADALEGFAARHADCVILPDLCRVSQVPASVKELRIIENVPFFDGAKVAGGGAEKHCIVKLAYVGILETQHRGLEDLLSVAAQYPEKVELEIAGFGPLAEKSEKAMQAHENIRFHGPVTPARAIQIMGSCDVVVGMYYRTKAHHSRATPNKYYEHLMLGKPLLTTAGTPPGDKVNANWTGWALEEGEASISEFIRAVTIEECERLGQNALAQWNADYIDYFQDVVVGEYAAKLCSV